MHNSHPLYPSIKKTLISPRYACEKHMPSSITFSYARNFVALVHQKSQGAYLAYVALTEKQVRGIDPRIIDHLNIGYYQNSEQYKSRGYKMVIANEADLEIAKPLLRQAYDNLSQGYNSIPWHN